MLIGELPRIPICSFPTPLEEMPRLSAAIGGPRLLIKRDDLTGLAMGGNKARELEFILADAVAKESDVVITCGDAQSNHVRMVAAGAARLGLTCCVVVGPSEHDETQGNILLQHVLGAEIRKVASNAQSLQSEVMQGISSKFLREGRKPYIIPKGGASALGSAGYANCVLELAQQLNDMRVNPQWLFLATGSGGTQGGLVVGARWLMPSSFKVVGISVTEPRPVMTDLVVQHANEAAELLGAPFRISPEDVIVYDDYLGPGFGKPTPECLNAILLMARTEGIFLDPVFCSKGLAGLIDLVRRGVVGRDDAVVFLHTGGVPSLFAYDEEITAVLGLQ